MIIKLSRINSVSITLIVASIIILFSTISDQILNSALAQTTSSSNSTFNMNGAISSLVLGIPINTTTVDMNDVQKFILSGDWNMSAGNNNLTEFNANFYTGPANGGASNHTHQLYNFRASTGDNYVPIELTSDNSASISGILDVGTNGNSAWNDVNANVTISNGRTISVDLADEDTERHFMGQQIYGIVEGISN